MSIRIEALCRYTRQGASSRLRTILYAPYVARTGARIAFHPFYGEGHVEGLSAGKRKRGPPLGAWWRRLRDLRGMGDADLLWIEKEALPWLPWAVERRALPRGVPVVVDFDDAVFHRYDLHRSGVIRWLYGTKLDRLMAASTLVTAGNGYLADRARRAGARWVEIVPTVVDTAVYGVAARREAAAPPVIGWMGSPSTWGEYMLPMLPLLTQVAEETGARLQVVGANAEGGTHPLLTRLPWTEQTEVERLQAMDIGLMPLTNTPWARGKCGYKLIQYMACGLPVIASPVGVNVRIVEHGVNGFLARTDAEWREALITLLRDPDLRRRMGQAGRRKVEAEYSLQVWGPRLAALLRKAAGQDAGA